MPLVRINMRKGRPPEVRRRIADCIQAALVETLGIPDEDRFQVVNQYDDDGFIHTPAYLDLTYSRDLIMIEVIFIEGRSDDLKKALHKSINERIVKAVGQRPDDVFIIFQEIGRANVSFGKGLAQRAEGK